MPLLSDIKLWLSILAVGVLTYLLWAGGHALYRAGQNDVQIRWDKDKQDRDDEKLRVQDDNRKREKALRDTINKRDKEAQDAAEKLVADYATVIASLLHRPERPADSGSSPPSGSALACTGTQLYREDGEFLAGEAARADRLRIQLQRCQQIYDDTLALIKGSRCVPAQN